MILWSMSEHGKINRSESMEDIEYGAFMFTTNGNYIGRNTYYSEGSKCDGHFFAHSSDLLEIC